MNVDCRVRHSGTKDATVDSRYHRKLDTTDPKLLLKYARKYYRPSRTKLSYTNM